MSISLNPALWSFKSACYCRVESHFYMFKQSCLKCQESFNRLFFPLHVEIQHIFKAAITDQGDGGLLWTLLFLRGVFASIFGPTVIILNPSRIPRACDFRVNMIRAAKNYGCDALVAPWLTCKPFTSFICMSSIRLKGTPCSLGMPLFICDGMLW